MLRCCHLMVHIVEVEVSDVRSINRSSAKYNLSASKIIFSSCRQINRESNFFSSDLFPGIPINSEIYKITNETKVERPASILTERIEQLMNCLASLDRYL